MAFVPQSARNVSPFSVFDMVLMGRVFATGAPESIISPADP